MICEVVNCGGGADESRLSDSRDSSANEGVGRRGPPFLDDPPRAIPGEKGWTTTSANDRPTIVERWNFSGGIEKEDELWMGNYWEEKSEKKGLGAGRSMGERDDGGAWPG